MLAVLGQAALRTLLLAAAVQLGLWLLRVKRSHLRLAAWTVVLAASLAMPALQWASPLRLSVLPDLTDGEAWVQVASPQQQAPMLQAPVPPIVEDVALQAASIPWLEALYLLVGGILLLRLSVGTVLSLRLVRRAAPVSQAWTGGTRVRISRDIAAPVTVGRNVLLPPDALAWPVTLREAVLAHERAHVARRDFAMLLASQVNRAVFWFNPLSWWLHRRLATLAELASDDQAMAATGDRLGYAGVLLEMGRRPGPPLQGLAMARPATLEHRIERILADRMPTASVSPAQQLMLVIGVASLSIMTTGSRPRSVLPPGFASTLASSAADQEASPTLADLDTAPAMLPKQEPYGPVPVQVPQTEAVLHLLAQPAPSVAVAVPPNAPGIRGASQPSTRATARNTLPPSSPRSMVQRVRSDRDIVAQKAPSTAGTVALAQVAPRGDEGRGTTNSPGAPSGAGAQAPPTHRGDQLPASDASFSRRGDGPFCTGVYLRQGGPTADGAADVVHAVYFQEADGTPWLKLLLGARNRVRLNGLEVERTSYRTTVVTTLPRGTAHVTGTTHGTYGAIDYECVRPPSRS